MRDLLVSTTCLGALVSAGFAPLSIGCGNAVESTFLETQNGTQSSEDDESDGFGRAREPNKDARDQNVVCGRTLTGTVRDFREFPQGGHPDFQSYTGFGQKRMVLPFLGSDHKPVYNPDPDEAILGYGASSPPGKHKFITSPESFAQWFRDVPGVNIPIRFDLELTRGPNGVSTYSSSAFFPIDDKGFGNQGRPHNYSFTFELHTEFVYKRGDVFTFSGDDDLWTFINGKLAIDLGGLHEPVSATVDLDARASEFGLVEGETYPLDIFHAERHTELSNFRIDTSIDFTNCEPIIH